MKNIAQLKPNPALTFLLFLSYWQLLPMPKDIYKVFNVYASPMLSVKGFENVEFFKFVTIQVPRPSPTGYSTDQTKLVQLKNDVWQEMENIKFDVEDTNIKFHVRHFCW